jgi:hypothetical protein
VDREESLAMDVQVVEEHTTGGMLSRRRVSATERGERKEEGDTCSSLTEWATHFKIIRIKTLREEYVLNLSTSVRGDLGRARRERHTRRQCKAQQRESKERREQEWREVGED